LTRRDVKFPRLWSNLDGALLCFCVNRTADTYRTDLKIPSEDPVCPPSKAKEVLRHSVREGTLY
jgi:hypothetical protein